MPVAVPEVQSIRDRNTDTTTIAAPECPPDERGSANVLS